jgi:hypothetical protein
VWVAANAGGTGDWAAPVQAPEAQAPHERSTRGHRGVAAAVLALSSVSSVVGRPSRSLERLQGAPLPATARLWALRARGGREWACAPHATASAHFRCQTWCCESGSHQSRSPRSRTFRGGRPSTSLLGRISGRRRGSAARGGAVRRSGEDARCGDGQSRVECFAGGRELLSRRKGAPDCVPSPATRELHAELFPAVHQS